MWLCRCRQTGSITITRSARPPSGRIEAKLLAARQTDERDKDVTFKNCAPFIKWIRRISNAEIDNTKDIDMVMQMYTVYIIIQKHLKVCSSTIKMIQIIV